MLEKCIIKKYSEDFGCKFTWFYVKYTLEYTI